jgi:hypothetical protein
MTEHTSPDTKVGYVFQLVTGLSDNQQLTISGNLALHATKEEMGLEFDKLLAVTKRLAVQDKIEKKKADITQGETIVNAMKGDIEQMDKSKGDKPLNLQEKNNREAMVSNIRRTEGKLEADRKALAELEKEAE